MFFIVIISALKGWKLHFAMDMHPYVEFKFRYVATQKLSQLDSKQQEQQQQQQNKTFIQAHII